MSGKTKNYQAKRKGTATKTAWHGVADVEAEKKKLYFVLRNESRRS